MKYMICADLGCVYRSSSVGGEVEYAPILDGETFQDDEFSPVEEDLVGGEPVTFEGVDTTLSHVFRTVEKRLA